ncbi:hypothetical protein [Streptomyces niveus]|uniref:hypothetical protein n=1 Tax=Streptomyces niveus TaxID=193462 RepID=UPI0003C5C0A4|nr:hypothetical protein [Streptomyces niveus]EST24921.1 hypothetical protein M877_23730 [Streptomyces niveus NCIMB 11891]
MIRNIIGSVLAVIGAAGAVASPFQSWYDGRHGRDYRVEDLFNGITGTSSDLWVSLLLPFAFAALVTLLGLVLRSRLLVALSGLIVLGFTILWMVRQGQRSDGLTLNSDGTGIGLGVAAALGGGALLLIAAAVMSGRRSRGGRGSHRYVAGDRAPERYGGYGDTGQVGYDEPEPYRTHQYPPYDAGHPPAGSTEQHAWDDTREQQPWTPPPQQPPQQPPQDERP